MKAIHINSTNRTINLVDQNSLEDCQRYVGGLITTAIQFEDGHTLFVDDEGLLKQPVATFFWHPEGHQPFAGNGLVVGPANENGDDTDCTMSIEDLRRDIRFFMPHEVIAMMEEGGFHA